MHLPNRISAWVLCTAAALLLPVSASAQQHRTPQPAADQPALTDAQAADLQEQLLKLLRTSPTLTSVVARDPSLLADQQYVTRNNPELEQFLVEHPDVARNPEFYLFSHLPDRRGRRDQALERAVWPELPPPGRAHADVSDVISPIAALAAFACFLLALVWIIRTFVESRRWSRVFKQQTDIHARLIDKFSTSQELAAYMETEAGRRFLQPTPMQMEGGVVQRMPNAVARVLTPVQIGTIMVLLGIGFLVLRHANPDAYVPMLITGTLVLMPGIGFILSAAVTWVLARRLGLMPKATHESDAPFGSASGPGDRL
jgi:hypothetical protein